MSMSSFFDGSRLDETQKLPNKSIDEVSFTIQGRIWLIQSHFSYDEIWFERGLL